MADIAPSILAADFDRIEEEVRALDAAGVGILHLDVMDGIFVPNTTFDAELVEQLRPLTNMVFDTHLMVVEPGLHIEDYLMAGSDSITIHYEASSDLESDLLRLRGAGARAGLSIKPDTEVEEIEHLLQHLDLVLVMSVEPGFGGQEFMPDAVPKIKRLAELKNAYGYYYNIQVDGGVKRDHIAPLVEAGAELLVMGTAFFAQPDYAAALQDFRQLARYRMPRDYDVVIS